MPNHQSTHDVVIVGGGVIGCATAYFLAKLHGVRALVLQRDKIASNASGNAAGELSPMSQRRLPDDITKFCIEGVKLHREWAPAIASESGLDYALTEMPVLRPALDDAEERETRGTIEWCRSLGMNAEWLDAGAMQEMDSWLSSDIRGAAYAIELQLETPAFATALARAATLHGATIQTDAEVVAVTVSGSQQIVDLKTDRHVAQSVVFATGPWSDLPAKALGVPVPVIPLRGQIVYLKPSRPLPSTAIFHSTGYVLPKPSSALMVGTTEEDAGFACETTDAARDDILRATQRLAPATAGMNIERMTACLRPLSKDGLPIIGGLESKPGLYVATGHGRKGIVLSLATGKHLADLMVTGHTSYPLDAFSPSRFVTG